MSLLSWDVALFTGAFHWICIDSRLHALVKLLNVFQERHAHLCTRMSLLVCKSHSQSGPVLLRWEKMIKQRKELTHTMFPDPIRVVKTISVGFRDESHFNLSAEEGGRLGRG